jgi:pimeloyl-ACP methyl ester carboxylesterase
MFITVDGVDLHIRETGTGTPVVLLHGWPDDGELWRHQVPVLAAAGYRVIVPDLRGFGASGKPTDVDAYGPSHQIGDVIGVLDALEVPRAHVVGHDWGAAIGWLVASLAGDRVASLTALSVGHPAAVRTAGRRQLEKSWYFLLFQFREVAERWLSDNDFQHLREWAGHPDIEPVVRRLSDPAALTASLGPYRAMLPPESLLSPPPQWPPVTVPTMGVWSAGDGALVEAGMANSSRYVTGPWRYERIDNAGHWIPLEVPDRLNELLLDFLPVPST